MKINVITIGKLKEDYLKVGTAEFIKRLRPYCNMLVTELAEEKMPEKPSNAEKQQAINKEGGKLAKVIKPDDFVIVLDVTGKMLASEDLAELLQEKALQGKSNISIVIGGAYGLSDEVKNKADFCLSFSKLTFTHQMIRLLLFEQIYRAFKIINKEKYHN